MVAAALSGRPPVDGSMSAAIQCRKKSPVMPNAARTSRASGSSRTTARAFVPAGRFFHVKGNDLGLAGPPALAPYMASKRPTDTRPLSKPVSGGPATTVVDREKPELAPAPDPPDIEAHPARDKRTTAQPAASGAITKRDFTLNPPCTYDGDKIAPGGPLRPIPPPLDRCTAIPHNGRKKVKAAKQVVS